MANMKRHALCLCAAWAAIVLTSCSDNQPIETEQTAFDALGVKPMPAPEEYAEQRTMIERVNNCLGLLESAAGITDEDIRAELKRRGISEITSREIRPLLSIANELERNTSLPDYEVTDIVEKMRRPVGSSLELQQRLDDIGNCAELSRKKVQKPVQ